MFVSQPPNRSSSLNHIFFKLFPTWWWLQLTGEKKILSQRKLSLVLKFRFSSTDWVSSTSLCLYWACSEIIAACLSAHCAFISIRSRAVNTSNHIISCVSQTVDHVKFSWRDRVYFFCMISFWFKVWNFHSGSSLVSVRSDWRVTQTIPKFDVVLQFSSSSVNISYYQVLWNLISGPQSYNAFQKLFITHPWFALLHWVMCSFKL